MRTEINAKTHRALNKRYQYNQKQKDLLKIAVKPRAIEGRKAKGPAAR